MAAKQKYRGLGRGLDALFADQAPVTEPEKDAAVRENAVIYVDINDIKPNLEQPRKLFNEEKIRELAASIVEHGIIQPVVLRVKNGTYEIVAGERRWRAARKAGLREIPAIIRNFSDEENILISIIENMQREDLSPIEEAEGLNRMMKVYGLTQEEVSKSVSKSRPYISNALRLLKLPEEIKDLVTEGKISAGHARALITIENEKTQAEICAKIIKDDLSVRKTEELVSKIGRSEDKTVKKNKSPEAARLEDQLRAIFGTKVSITQGRKKGRIELEYYSKDELNRLIELLKTVRP